MKQLQVELRYKYVVSNPNYIYDVKSRSAVEMAHCIDESKSKDCVLFVCSAECLVYFRIKYTLSLSYQEYLEGTTCKTSETAPSRARY